MRIMTGDAAQLSCALAVTLAEPHGERVLQQVILGLKVRTKRDYENAQRVIKVCTGMKIPEVPACPQNTGIAGLMTTHTDVVCLPRCELRRINNCLGTGRGNVRSARTVTVFTTDS
jgi:hypothetical protein